MRYTAETEMKTGSADKLFLLEATEFRGVGADMKDDDTQRTPCLQRV